MSLISNQAQLNENATQSQSRVHNNNQRKRIQPNPVTTNNERSFGRVLQPIPAALKRVTYSKPNPHERLWNPSPSKRARGREKDVATYNYDKENEINEASEKQLTLKEDCKENLENLRNRYIIDHPGNFNKNGSTTSSDLNNSFTEKISNLDIGPQVESPCLPTKLWNEHKDPEYPYITEILNYWHQLEVNYRINPNYMSKQKEISHKMRTILVDWLAEVTEECGMCNATFHRCIHFVDRFLSKSLITRGNLQLLGTTCLYIACKVEEIHPPDTGELIYLTDNTYNKSQLLRMECLVLSILDFDLMVPTAHEFTQYFSSCLEMSTTARSFTFYVVDLTLLYGEKFLRYNASVTAAAACYVSLRCCGATFEDTSIRGVLGRIKRLHPNGDFYKSVEHSVSSMFGMLMTVGSEKDVGNSVCNRYREFQDQKYFIAAASCAACLSVPWYSAALV